MVCPIAYGDHNKQTPLETSTSLRYATPVGKYFGNDNKCHVELPSVTIKVI